MKIWSGPIAQNMNKKIEKFCPEFFKLFRSYFGQWDDSIFSFWNLLTFTTKANYWGLSQCELSHCKSFCGLCQTFLWFFSWQIAIKYWNLPTKSLPIHCPHNHLVSHDSVQPQCSESHTAHWKAYYTARAANSPISSKYMSNHSYQLTGI